MTITAQDLFRLWVPLVHQDISVTLRDESIFEGSLLLIDPVSASIVLDRGKEASTQSLHQVLFIPAHSIRTLTKEK